jgi:hypothetical protein
MAFKFAQEYDVSPWEALLYVIRITAGRVRYCEFVLSQANDDRELEGKVQEGEAIGVSPTGQMVESRNLAWWVETSERERLMLAKVSKAAIDAGVAQILVEKELADGNRLADGLLGVYESLREAGALSGEQLETVLEAMKAQLQRMDVEARGAGGQRVLEG